MDVAIRHIGKSAEDLRFFISFDGQHAGGITVHSVSGASFSYGIAIAPPMRQKGVARAALALLFDAMRERGFSRAVVMIAPENAASLALHRAMGFEETARDARGVRMERTI